MEAGPPVASTPLGVGPQLESSMRPPWDAWDDIADGEHPWLGSADEDCSRLQGTHAIGAPVATQSSSPHASGAPVPTQPLAPHELLSEEYQKISLDLGRQEILGVLSAARAILPKARPSSSQMVLAPSCKPSSNLHAEPDAAPSCMPSSNLHAEPDGRKQEEYDASLDVAPRTPPLRPPIALHTLPAPPPPPQMPIAPRALPAPPPPPAPRWSWSDAANWTAATHGQRSGWAQWWDADWDWNRCKQTGPYTGYDR